jgi:hypothetical protein
MAQQVLQDSLRDACLLIEGYAHDAWALKTKPREHFEDVWADEEPERFAAWERLTALANCRPEVKAMDGHCWECGRDLRPVMLYPEDPIPRGRFLRCTQHARWVMAGNDD